jgi:hypothetical protein
MFDALITAQPSATNPAELGLNFLSLMSDAARLCRCPHRAHKCRTIPSCSHGIGGVEVAYNKQP